MMSALSNSKCDMRLLFKCHLRKGKRQDSNQNRHRHTHTHTHPRTNKVINYSYLWIRERSRWWSRRTLGSPNIRDTSKLQLHIKQLLRKST